MTPPVDYSDKRYFQLVDWLANEHKVLSQVLRREPTDEEHRAHAHAFVDLVFDDQAKAGAAWAAAAATKIVRFVPPVGPGIHGLIERKRTEDSQILRRVCRTAALRDFDRPYIRFGSFTTEEVEVAPSRMPPESGQIARHLGASALCQ